MSKLNLNDYYFHATGGPRGFYNKEHRILQILADGEIKTNESMRIHGDEMNKDNEICLIDNRKTINNCNDSRKYQNALGYFCADAPTIVIDRNISVYEPPACLTSEIGIYRKGESIMFNEVRHEGNISIDHLKFLFFPISLEKHPFFRYSLQQQIMKLNIFKYDISVILENYKNIKIFDLYDLDTEVTEDYVTSKIDTWEKKLK